MRFELQSYLSFSLIDQNDILKQIVSAGEVQSVGLKERLAVTVGVVYDDETLGSQV